MKKGAKLMEKSYGYEIIDIFHNSHARASNICAQLYGVTRENLLWFLQKDQKRWRDYKITVKFVEGQVKKGRFQLGTSKQRAYQRRQILWGLAQRFLGRFLRKYLAIWPGDQEDCLRVISRKAKENKQKYVADHTKHPFLGN